MRALEAERALATMSKLRGRMQEERRALQALQQQLAQDPRAGSGSGDDGGHWLLEKQLPLAVLIRVAPGGATRGDAKEQPRGWGELPVDRAQGSSTEEEDADDVDGVLCIPVAMVQDMKVMTKNIPGLAPSK